MEGMSSKGVASDWYRTRYSKPPCNQRPRHTHTVSGAIKELANITMNPHLHFLSEGLVCFWWNAIESRSLARLELVDGLVNFTEREWVINFHQLLPLGDQVKNAEVNWLMVTEHKFEVRAEDSHVLTC